MIKPNNSRLTIAERLEQVKNRPSGFDYMRIALAVSVICWHSVVTSYGNQGQEQIWASTWWVPFAFILPMFFTLSGFLVASSFERCRTLITFIGFRIFRIIPALSVETLNLGAYFRADLYIVAAQPIFLAS
jgi:peptidoglycan/LPS O-acetylase OafA/YrhL